MNQALVSDFSQLVRNNSNSNNNNNNSNNNRSEDGACLRISTSSSNGGGGGGGMHRSFRSYFHETSMSMVEHETRDSSFLKNHLDQAVSFANDERPLAMKKRKSAPISMRLSRSDSERQLAESEQAADYRDYCMYVRIVNGIQQKSPNTTVSSMIDPSLASIMRTRQEAPHNERWKEHTFYKHHNNNNNERVTPPLGMTTTNNNHHPSLINATTIVDPAAGDEDEPDDIIFDLDM